MIGTGTPGWRFVIEAERGAILSISTLLTLAWAGTIFLVSPSYLPTVSETIATAASIACVWLTRRDDIWCWPVGIVAVMFLAVALRGYGMTAQMWLQIGYFLPIQILSWWWWRDREELPITFGTRGWNAVALACAVILAVLAAVFLGSDRIGAWFWIDGWITGASIVAQFLMGRRYAESWLWWALAVNVPSIILYVDTDALMLAALYVGFLAHAVLGWREWARAADDGRQCGTTVLP